MKRITTLLLIAGLFFSVKIKAQSWASAVWALDVDTTAVTVGNVNALDQKLTDTLSIKDFTGSPAFGTAERLYYGGLEWPAETAPEFNRYVQFVVMPKPGYNFTVDTVAYYWGCYGTHGHFHANSYWDTDTLFYTKHMLDTTTAGLPDLRDNPVPDTAFVINTTIKDGGEFVLRFFPWYDLGGSSSKYFCLYNVRIFGTTSPATAVKESKEIPAQFQLKQNYPNPFNPSTTIDFSLAKSGYTTLIVYNLLGQRVKTLIAGNMSSGLHSFDFNASALNSGIYFYKLTSGNQTSVKKLILMK